MENIVVWFSCGAASAVAAKKTIEKYGKSNVRVVNSPILEEDIDNRRFLKDIEQWLGIEIEFATNSKYPSNSAVDVWEKVQYMSGIHGAPCTRELKKEARYQWQEINKPDWHVLGFVLEEKKRHDMFVISELPNVLPVLIDDGITKADCFDIIKTTGIELPLMYRLKYPNANCVGCCKATSPTYWNHVRKHHPEVFRQRAEQSRAIGCRLVRVKGKRLFLDELDPEAKGNSMKGMSFECGVFCEVTN